HTHGSVPGAGYPTPFSTPAGGTTARRTSPPSWTGDRRVSRTGTLPWRPPNLDAGVGKLPWIVLVWPFFAIGHVRVLIRKKGNQRFVGNEAIAEVVGAEVEAVVERQPADAGDGEGDGRVRKVESMQQVNQNPV